MLSLAGLSASAALLASQPASLRSCRAAHPHGRCAARMAADEKRIVVTGLGTVTALGSGDQFWDSLVAGESGVDTITAFDASRFPTTIGAECKDFDAKACRMSKVYVSGCCSRANRQTARGSRHTTATGPETDRRQLLCLPSARRSTLTTSRTSRRPTGVHTLSRPATAACSKPPLRPGLPSHAV